MLIKRGKKGQGHIEMIISFSLFIGFVVTILLFYRPTVKSKDISLGVVERELMNNLTTDFYFFSVKMSGESDCFCFSSEYFSSGMNVIAYNSSKDKINAGTSGNSICIESGNNDFFYIYLSPEFGENNIECSNSITISNDNIGLLREAKVISNSALSSLKERYDIDYNRLKEELKITYDFRLAVFDELGDKILEFDKTAPLGRPVYSKDISIEILHEDGMIQKGTMKVYAW